MSDDVTFAEDQGLIVLDKVGKEWRIAKGHQCENDLERELLPAHPR